jgi:lysophospholipase L1-like esterase
MRALLARVIVTASLVTGVAAVPSTAVAAMADPAAGTPRPCPAVPGQPSGGSPRIMVVGDSISQGTSGDYTWRYRLYQHLVADGLRPRMVGPFNWLFDNVTSTEGACDYADPRFETAHDTWWGDSLGEEAHAIRGRVAAYQPDYLLVLLGIDDLVWGGSDVAGAEANVKKVAATARAANPAIRIVFGRLLPRTDVTHDASVGRFNADLPRVAARLSTLASPVAVADDAAGFNPATDTWDGTHPNAEGDIKIAASFADVLATRLGLGSPYPVPLPVVRTGPITAPRLTATSGNGSARLSWTLSPGADGYYLYVRNVTARQTAFTREPYPLAPSQDPWAALDLAGGVTYQFKLQACKKVDCNAFSNTASATPPRSRGDVLVRGTAPSPSGHAQARSGGSAMTLQLAAILALALVLAAALATVVIARRRQHR